MKRPYRIVVAKPGLDGHDRGAKTITRALRDHGFEVIYTGLHQTPEQIAETVLQEDADGVGLSLLSGAHLTLFPRVMEELRNRDLGDVLVFGGGVIPDADARALQEQGVAKIFGPGSSSTSNWRVAGRRPWTRPKPVHHRHSQPIRTHEREGTPPWISLNIRASSTSPAMTFRSALEGPADTVDEAVKEAASAGYPVVVKAQVQVGGRGKAGGIKLADNEAEVREHAGNILGMDIKGHVVRRFGSRLRLILTRSTTSSSPSTAAEKKHLMMLSREGGVEIEVVAEENPDAIVKLHIDPVDGLPRPIARRPASMAKLPERAIDGATDILVKLYRCYDEGDCDLAEINPLILKPTGEVHALDAKVTLDGNAEFRHPEWDAFRGLTEMDDREKMAAEKDLQYIGLDGTVGIIANGAGLAMSTLDVVNQVGGSAANFLDIGGGANADVMAGRSKSSTSTRTSSRSSSTSSAASPAAKKLPRASSRRWVALTSKLRS